MNQEEIIQLIQLTLGRVDTLLILLTAIATIFGIIVAIVIAFFAIRHINVDREIRRYRDEIKEQKEKSVKEVEKIKNTLLEMSKWASGIKNEIEKEIKKSSKSSKPTKTKLIELENKIDELEKDIAYKRGAISGTAYSSGYAGVVLAGDVKCKKCGGAYNENFNLLSEQRVFSTAEGLEIKNENKCPFCGNIN